MIRVDNNDSMVTCAVCAKDYHLTCSGVGQATFKDINKKDSQVFWVCVPCSPLARNLLTGMGDLQKKLSDVTEKYGDLAKRVETLESGGSVGNGTGSGNRVMAPGNCDEIVQSAIEEFHDLIRRKRNLVIFGAPEKGSGFLNMEEDKEFVREVFGVMDADPACIIEYRRLGKPREGSEKPRLLRIRFDSEEHKYEALSKAKSLKGSRYASVYVKPDLTPRQVKADKLLYDMMKSINADGKQMVRRQRGKLVPLNGTGAPSA
jgi:hypothetical protein